MSEDTTDKECFISTPDQRFGIDMDIIYDCDQIKVSCDGDEIYLGDLIRELVKNIKDQDLNKTRNK